MWRMFYEYMKKHLIHIPKVIGATKNCAVCFTSLYDATTWLDTTIKNLSNKNPKIIEAQTEWYPIWYSIIVRVKFLVPLVCFFRFSLNKKSKSSAHNWWGYKQRVQKNDFKKINFLKHVGQKVRNFHFHHFVVLSKV